MNSHIPPGSAPVGQPVRRNFREGECSAILFSGHAFTTPLLPPLPPVQSSSPNARAASHHAGAFRKIKKFAPNKPNFKPHLTHIKSIT
jgi:hypothetical protein